MKIQHNLSHWHGSFDSFQNLKATVIATSAFLFNLVTVFFSSRYLFQQNSRGLFGFGWDQPSILSFGTIRHQFSNVLLGTGSDPVNGLGNVAFPINLAWLPTSIISSGSTGYPDAPFAFAVAATYLFAVTAACGRFFKYGLAISVAAAWLITLLTWPLFLAPKIVALWLYVPHYADILCIAFLVAVAAVNMGHGSIRKTYLLSFLAFVGLSYIVFAAPTFFAIVGIPIALFAIACLVQAENQAQRKSLVISWAMVGLLCLSLGYLQYIYGLVSYTAASFFPDLSKRIPTMFSGETTLLLWSPFSSIRTFFDEPVRVFISGGLLGGACAIWLGTAIQKKLAICVLSSELVLVLIGLANYYLKFWIGPAIWYLEHFLFPFFALGCCYLVISPFILAQRLCSAYRNEWGIKLNRLTPTVNLLVAILIPLVAGGYSLKAGKSVEALSRTYIGYDFSTPFPQKESDLTLLLKSEIALSPGKPFRGRVATMAGRIFPKERYWGRFSLGHYFAQFATGNLHDGPGLWQSNIPTLLEYNQLMTPAYFTFVRTFFSEPDDIIFRNVIGTRHIDPRLLKLIGVRYVLTDLPTDHAALKGQITIPTPPAAKKRLEFDKLNIESYQMYLYEYSDVNLGQFSPRNVIRAPDANQILNLMSNPEIDLKQNLIIGPDVTEDMPLHLTDAALESFTILKNGYSIRAKSNGLSILLLPIEFSRCLTITGRSNASMPKLVRADLLLTAVLFDKELAADISYYTGPFQGADCRRRDVSDAHLLRMQDAFRDRPEFGKLGWQDYWDKK